MADFELRYFTCGHVAINHAAPAVQAAASIAVAALSALPQLGFIHEDSDQSFVLDVADLYRESMTLRIAFHVAKRVGEGEDQPIDRLVRHTAAREFKRQRLIPKMIDDIKSLLGMESHEPDGAHHP